MVPEEQQIGDLRATLALSQSEALTGTRRILNLPGGRQVTVPIPAGIHDGQQIRLEGQGAPDSTGESRGALILTIAITPTEQPGTQFSPPEEIDRPTHMIEPLPPQFPSALSPRDPYPTYQAYYTYPPQGPGEATFINSPPQSQTQAPAYFSQIQSASEYTQPEQYMPPEEPRRRRLSAGVVTLIMVLILLLIGGSGLIYYTTIYQPGQMHMQATATAQAQSTGTARVGAQITAQAQATVRTQAHATSTAQALALAQATATATALQNIYTEATGGQPVLNDSLSAQDAYDWSEGTGCAFTNGAYHASDSTKANFIYCIAQATNFSNFAYQVQMTIVKGDYGGIVFRADAANTKFYFFRVSQNGEYDLYLYVDNTGTNARTLTTGSTSAIHAGLNQTNFITVVARGNNLYFYVNKQFIAHVSDSTYSSGQIGVVANDLENATDVVFSQAQVWTL